MHAHPTRTLLILLGLIVLCGGIAYAGFVIGGTFMQPTSPIQQAISPVSGFPAGAPAPRPQDYVAQQKGFQYLVLYTSNGFVPAKFSAKKGETIRFANNSSGPLPLSIAGMTVPPLGLAEYFEYTLTQTGNIMYSDGTHSGTITVN